MVGTMVEGNSSYRTALDHGVPENKARMIGAMVGIAAGAIEAYGGHYVEGFLEKVASKITNKVFIGARRPCQDRFSACHACNYSGCHCSSLKCLSS